MRYNETPNPQTKAHQAPNCKNLFAEPRSRAAGFNTTLVLSTPSSRSLAALWYGRRARRRCDAPPTQKAQGQAQGQARAQAAQNDLYEYAYYIICMPGTCSPLWSCDFI